jgi:hypothetical protein
MPNVRRPVDFYAIVAPPIPAFAERLAEDPQRYE